MTLPRADRPASSAFATPADVHAFANAMGNTMAALLDVIAGRAVSVVKASDAVVVERGTTAPPPAG